MTNWSHFNDEPVDFVSTEADTGFRSVERTLNGIPIQ